MKINKQTPSGIEPSSNSPSFYDRIVNSVVLKMLVIFILTLLMLIPMSFVHDLIAERSNRELSVSRDIFSKWGGPQVVSSPILAIPFKYMEETTQKDKNGNDFIVQTAKEDWLFVLPEKADMQVKVTPEYLKRGIYQSVVYHAKMEIRGDFGKIDWENLHISKESINWSQVKLVLGVQDVKGLSTALKINFDEQTYAVKNNSKLFNLFPNNIIADLKLSQEEDMVAPFYVSYELKGSKSFNFLPLANQNKLEVSGDWSNPSFNGGYLPDNRSVEDNAFNAIWNIPSYGRKLPAYWIGASEVYHFQDISLSDESFTYTEPASSTSNSSSISSDQDMVQVNFLPEVNNYQKTTRVAKYGILVVILTFASLFFTEIIKRQRIHLVQYILIGAAMVLFYSLLLAISEHLGFNLAYLVAAIATTGLIAFFIYMITKNKNTALLFVGILGLFYLFIYVLMQLRDYSLIVGTVGIFIILAVLMRVSTKVNWYQFDR